MRRRAPGAFAAIALAALAACTGSSDARRSAPPPVAESEIRAIADRGYVPDRVHATAALAERWTGPRGTLDVSFVAPSSGGPFPLVIYLPGLGETAAAGAIWRNAWAAGGYAVLAIQPVEAGDALWRSARARAGEFRAMAREFFAPATLAGRLDDIRFARAELERRARAGVAPFAAADPARVALAGFDLGAQTVLAAAGEAQPGLDRARLGFTPRAVIALSPFVDLAAGGVRTRFERVDVPALTVTGSDDVDPYGLVGSPALRRAPFQSMPAGDKHLLVLAAAGHALLAGSSLVAPPGGALLGGGPAERFDAGERDRRGRRFAPLDALNQAPGGGRRSRNAPVGDDEGRGPTPIVRGFDAAHFAAVQSVSLAFLDAAVRADPIAREWLARDAARFIGTSATLESK